MRSENDSFCLAIAEVLPIKAISWCSCSHGHAGFRYVDLAPTLSQRSPHNGEYAIALTSGRDKQVSRTARTRSSELSCPRVL